MDPGILTTTLGHFLTVFSHSWGNLQPAINFLIKVFLGIEILMFGLWMALGGMDNIASAIKKLLYLLFWLWFVQKFPVLADTFVRSLIQAGQMAAGGGGGNLFDPSGILRIGLHSLDPAFAEIVSQGSLLKLVNSLVLGLCFLLIALGYILIAWQIFYAIIEFYLVFSLVGLFLPFGFFEPTKFLAEKAIGAVVSSGIKLMVLSFLITVIVPVLNTLDFSGDLTYKEVLSAVLTVGALAFLCWNAPGVAAGLMSGSPSLTAGTALQNMAVAGGAAAIGAWGAIKAAGATFSATRAAVTAGLNSKSVQTAALATNPGSARVANDATGGGFGKQKQGSSTPDSGGNVAGTTTQSGTETQPKKDNSSEWAKTALKAMQHTPQEAHPSGGGSQPKL